MFPQPPSLDEVQAFAEQGYNRVPLFRELLSDLDTPLSAYLKTSTTSPFSFLLESVEGGEQWGRYSFIGLPCQHRLEIWPIDYSQGEARVRFLLNGSVEERVTHDPFQEIRQWWSQHKVAPIPGLPPFTGGLVGYFGYDCVRYVEHLPAVPEDEMGLPDAVLLLAEELLIFDNLSGRILLLTHMDISGKDPQAAYQAGLARLDHLQGLLSDPLPPLSRTAESKQLNEEHFTSTCPQARFEQAVIAAKDYIREGDIMQVVLSQQLHAPFTARPLDLYRALRSLNPSPYMYHLDLADFHIVGSSPEVLVRLQDGTVTVRPIAGTRPRGKNPVEDSALAEELLADPKELAEHLMLLDLGRNDVGRVAATGTVQVTKEMVIERYSHVMHIVSNVEGQLKDGLDAFDCLTACFPAGTLSGAAKVRAMEIIDELEVSKRGYYAGAVGYIGWNGNMDTAIAIRTALIKDGKVHVQAGAGIVADSVPETEWEETMNKGRAVLRAAQWAASGL